MRKLAIFTAGFAMAAALCVYMVLEARALWFAGACLLLSPLALAGKRRRLCVLALGLAVGFTWCTGYRQLWLAPADRLCRQEQVVTVSLTEDPVEIGYGVRARAEWTAENRTYEVFFYGNDDLLDAKAGDRVTALVQAEPTGLDLREGETLYQRSSGTVLRLFAKEELCLEEGEAAWTARLRQSLQERMDAMYQGETAGLLRALVTGDRSGLSYQTENDLAVAGLSHAIAVSGMHVAMLLSMISFACGRNPRLTAMIGIPVIVVFTVLTGASPSAIRSAVMYTLILLAPLAGRESDQVTNLAFAALVLLMENPWSISSVSSQLSFAAVLGLMLMARPIRDRLLPSKGRAGRIRQFLAASVASSLSAIMATLPLTALYFRSISLAAVLVNVLALWAVTGIFVLGLLSCLVPILHWPVAALSQYVLTLSRWAARFPYAAAYGAFLPMMIWAILAYGALVWLIFAKKARVPVILSVLTAGFLLCIWWGRYDLFRGNPVIRVLDVGQGQSVLWKSGDFTAILDCGGSYPEEAGETAARTLHSGGQTYVDAIVVTHYDEDHGGGVVQLLHRIEVGMVIMPDSRDESGLKASIAAAAESAGCQVVWVNSLTEITCGDGSITVFPPVSREDSNNSGICVLARAGEYDMFISGDLDQNKELRLCSLYALPQVELLLAGHHGAESSSSAYLLDRLQPMTVAISVGADNAYGHPAQETLDRIAAAGAEIYRTDQAGTLVFRGKE